MKNENKEAFYPSWFSRCMFYFSVILTPLIILGWWFGFIDESPLLFYLLVPLCLFLTVMHWKVTAKVVITEYGIKYSDILTEIDCRWEDIYMIYKIPIKSIYDGTLLSVGCNDYKFQTRKQDFLLESYFYWNSNTLERIREKIISIAPQIQIVETSGRIVNLSGGL